LSRQNGPGASKTTIKRYHRKEFEFCRQKCALVENATETRRASVRSARWMSIQSPGTFVATEWLWRFKNKN
jgi:hypothetical protein